ncbi:MAG: F0F1 ATP synthase subunit delta [Candidatus Omnitrophica bacterium]|nr:F0F1 ATP synthase subunit delta [Candidatus Omnitrophota bacterium]
MLLIPIALALLTAFVTLVAVLRWFMGRYAMTATARLQDLSQDYLRKQEELKKRLEESERHYQEQLAKSQEAARQLKAQAIREANSERQQMLEQARQEAERVVQQAMQTREALQRDFTQSVEVKAVERGCEMLRQVLPEEFRQVVHQQWMDQLLQNGLLEGEALKAAAKVEEASVATAFPLTETDRSRLAERLAAALGRSIRLQETVEPGLVAGLRITVGHLVLDGSLASKLREAARQAQEAARRGA